MSTRAVGYVPRNSATTSRTISSTAKVVFLHPDVRRQHEHHQMVDQAFHLQLPLRRARARVLRARKLEPCDRLPVARCTKEQDEQSAREDDIRCMRREVF
jgi:hypothetical protein